MNPQATNHSISWIRKLHIADELDLSPTFQRKPVWSDAQASYLIDSILNDLPVPEIFLRAQGTDEGETYFEVVDGQQRLRSIIRFFSSQLTLEGDDVSPAYAGLSWKDTSKPQRKAFYAFKLAVRELEDVSNAEVRDMFRRLNANQSSLNNQELRHSQYSGEFISFVEALADDPWWMDNRVVTVAQTRRMLDVEFVSELLVGLMAGPLDKKQGLDDYYVDYDDEFPDADVWHARFLEARGLAESVASDTFVGWRSKTEFYSLFLACCRLVNDGTTLTDPELGSARDHLAAFRLKVDEAKKKGTRKKFPKYVTDYVEATTRASTDLGRRLSRIDVVEALLLGRTPKA